MNVKKVFLWSFGLLFTLGILGCAAVAGLFYWASRDLPDLERLTGYEAPQATVILARDGSTIGTLATEKRYSITLKEMSPWLPMSFLAAEDDSFYQHHGVDPVAIVRAFIYNLRNKASGGGQQGGMRSGTENVPGIAGIAKAAQIMYDNYDQDIEKLYDLKKCFIEGVKKIDRVIVNGPDCMDGAPHIVSVSFSGVRSEVLLHSLEDKGIYVSAGSACSAHKPQPSATLMAMGVPKDLLSSTIRFSFSVFTTMEEINYTLEALYDIIPMLRKYTRK